ncbi:MAG: YdcF family protein [Hyphomicrobiaceae bacterium]
MGTVAAAGLAALLLGFLLFAADATRERAGDPPRADGIVVLTGGDLRIAEAGRLLSERRGRRLLVSGVHARTSEADVRRLASLPADLFACCVDIDRKALDTHGNAVETRRWVAQHKFQSLIVVTGTYHMLRSRLELASALPDLELHTHPVLPRGLRRSPWWLSPSSIRLLAGEYVKLLPVAARYAFATVSGPATSHPPPATPRRPAPDERPATHSASGQLGMGH